MSDKKRKELALALMRASEGGFKIDDVVWVISNDHAMQVKITAKSFLYTHSLPIWGYQVSAYEGEELWYTEDEVFVDKYQLIANLQA